MDVNRIRVNECSTASRPFDFSLQTSDLQACALPGQAMSRQQPYGTPTILREYSYKQLQQNSFCTTGAMLAESHVKASGGRHVLPCLATQGAHQIM